MAWRRVKLIYWQHECLTHPIPPGTIVYSSGSPTVSVVSPQWNRLSVTMDPFARTSLATVYLGQRVAPDGARRLVALTATSWAFHDDVLLEASTIELGGIYTSPTVTGDATIEFSANDLPEPPAGQPLFVVYSAVDDPSNPAHFTFCLDIADERYSCDCWLLSTGAIRIDKTVSKRPATMPSTAPAG
jgi:hypothetical protein